MPVDFEQDILHCLEVLKNGGLILYPTDTVWGIGCDATNPEAVERVYQLKQRPDSKAMIVLVADERDILQYVAAPDMEVFDYLDQVSRPTTVIYEGAIGFAENLVAADGSIAIRICKEEFCRHLIKRFRKPIVSTSANLSGQPAAKNFGEISDDIRKGVGYIVTHRQDYTRPASPSQLIKWENGKLVILRS
ncbi:MAG: threonylcarbamoyl-AMP synthase [Chitinophagaceae bacterium]|nr:threonylcarbamoyl-AMP synthase [Chitinophagaceae bacterium]